MLRTRSERYLLIGLALLAAPVALPAQEAAPRVSAQESARRIVSSEISVSRAQARLTLEFDDGRRAQFTLRDGQAFVGNQAVAAAPRGGELDRAWRELLQEAGDVPANELPALLAEWEAPGGQAFQSRLVAALSGVEAAPALNAGPAEVAEVADVPPVPPVPALAVQDAELSDSLERLVDRIRDLQDELEDRGDFPVRIELRNGRRAVGGPFRHVFAGLTGLFKSAIFYGVLFALAFATIFFGGRRFIEGVADTARAATTRSLLVGVAASFLVIPVFLLGAIALAISIVGIPALIAWIPLFPVAVGLALVLGYIGVAHAAGEALAERRFYASDWFQRGNSYYFLLTGLALLLSPFLAMNVARMAGPWLNLLYGICVAIGVLGTWAALSIGFGAVLISRGGTRPVRPAVSPEPEMYAESTSA